jgi:demethylmenaquinone methyltransferase/2-methoxy-6-polyprenyl-1,4-benzoquinol methylase
LKKARILITLSQVFKILHNSINIEKFGDMEKETTIQQNSSNPSSIQSMFNAIAPTYDFLNHLLSFGLDIRWRHRLVKSLEEKRGGTFLDIATGSGDLSVNALKSQPHQIVASDFAFEMLKVFEQKLFKRGNSKTIQLVYCDAIRLPFCDETFDATMVSFGIRNFSNRLQSLKEMRRVLNPNGISLILELTKPNTPVLSPLYKFYSCCILPLFGKVISRHNSAYKYLPESISNFPERDEFISLMNEAGFVETSAIRLSFGIATIFIGRKK